MKLKYFKYLYLLVPIVLACLQFKMACLNYYSRLGNILDCAVNDAIFVLIFWSLPGLLTPIVFHWWQFGRNKSKQLFFSFYVSAILFVVALLVRGVVGLTCGCVSE